MSKYWLAKVTDMVADEWRSGKAYGESFDAASTLRSIEWMIRELDNLPDCVTGLGAALSAWKNGARFEDYEERFKVIAESLKKS